MRPSALRMPRPLPVPKPVIFTDRLSLHARWRKMMIWDILLRRISDAPLPKSPGKINGIPQFIVHLKKFRTPGKGAILQDEGENWSRRYRFKTPLMRPYVVLKGIQDGFISQEDVMRFEYTENGRLVKPYQPSLFND